MHIDHQLAPGDYRIALQLVATAAEGKINFSDSRFQLNMKQNGELIRQLHASLDGPLALLREQFQGVWQLQSAEQTRVYIRLQGQSMELQVYEDGECQWLALQDAVTLPGGLRWQQEQLWLHTAFVSDLLYGAVGEDEFLPMQQASWPEGECEVMSF